MKNRAVFFLVALCAASLFVLAKEKSLPAIAEETDDIKLPVLMYHQVLDEPKKLGKYVISPQELESDLRLIRELGFETVTVSELIAYCNGKGPLPKKPIILTFDDGYQTDYKNVFPLLRQYNMKAVFSVVGAYTERYSTEGIDKHINYAHLSWDEISEMQKSGHCEFLNHSYNLHSLKGRHGCLKASGESDSDYREIIHDDIVRSQKLLAEKLGKAPPAFTYPYGGTNDTLREIIREEGFSASLGTYEEINVITGNPDELYDIRRFNRAHGRDIRKIIG